MIGFLTKYVLPLACIGVSAWLIYDGQTQLVRSKANHEQARLTLTAAQDAQLALDRLGDSKPILSERESPTEEARFLTGLRRHASMNGATVLKWSSTTETYKKDPKLPENDPLEGLTRVTSHIAVVGSYPSLQKFLQSISASRRFYTFSDVRWTRDAAGNRLALSLTRFVEPASENPKK
jgi:hypothetical protein